MVIMKKLLILLELLPTMVFAQSQNEWADLLIKNKLATTCTRDKSACYKIVGGLGSSFMIKQNSVALVISADDDNVVKMPSTCIALTDLKLSAENQKQSVLAQISFASKNASDLRSNTDASEVFNVHKFYGNYELLTGVTIMNLMSKGRNRDITMLLCELRKLTK